MDLTPGSRLPALRPPRILPPRHAVLTLTLDSAPSVRTYLDRLHGNSGDAWGSASSSRTLAGAAQRKGVCRRPRRGQAHSLKTGLCPCGGANASRFFFVELSVPPKFSSPLRALNNVLNVLLKNSDLFSLYCFQTASGFSWPHPGTLIQKKKRKTLLNLIQSCRQETWDVAKLLGYGCITQGVVSFF